MDSQTREQVLQSARALEERGDVDGAVRAYARIGAIEQAAVALMNARRHGEAARMYLRALGVPVDKMSGLDGAARQTAKKAAVLFANAGELQNSVDIFLSLGEPMQAAAVMEKGGDPVGAARIRATWGGGGPGSVAASRAAPTTGTSAVKRMEESGDAVGALEAYVHLKDFRNAGRVAFSLGRPADAARFFVEGGMPFEAGVCFARAGDTGLALGSFVRVSKDDAKYRTACVHAIAIAKRLNVLEFSLDDFLGRFVASAPQNAAEAAAFYDLAQLYTTHDFGETASELLKKLLAFDPSNREARARLAVIASEARGSAMVYEKILRDDAAFRGEASVRSRAAASASLPELPTLDDAPVVAATGAATQRDAPVDFLAPGTVIADRYVIQREIGRGGMAAVYEATDREIDDRIALKFFFGAGDSPEGLTRFKQELQLARKLIHPHIVQVFDIGTHCGSKFISMELLSGADLHAVIKMGLSLHRGLAYLLQACSGLGMAHDRGVVHRDIKPGNFFVTTQGALKIMDFGIAKNLSAPGITKAGFFAGTPEYMSPEQIQRFDSVTHLADIYALGIVAYECFTGAVPFAHAEMIPVLMMQVNELAPPPSTRNSSLPRELDAIVLRCLEKDPARRYPSCRALAVDLDGVFRRLAPPQSSSG